MLVHHFVVVVYVAEPAIQPHDNDFINQPGIHIFHHLAECFAPIQPLARGDSGIHINVKQFYAVRFGICADFGLLRIEGQPACGLLGGRNANIAHSANYIHAARLLPHTAAAARV